MWIFLAAGLSLAVISLLLLKAAICKRNKFFYGLFLPVFLLAVFLIFIGYNLSGYMLFNDAKKIAFINCRQVKGQLYDMLLTFRAGNSGSINKKEETFFLSGNQWAMQANILKIKFPLKLNMFKITQIKSRFKDLHNEDNSPRIKYNINSVDAVFSFLQRYNLAFAEASFLDTGYVSSGRASGKAAEFYLSDNPSKPLKENK